MKFHSFFILSVTGKSNISIGFYTSGTFVDAGRRMILTINGGNPRVCKIKGNIGHFSSGKISIILIIPNLRANNFTLATTGTISLYHISRFFGHLHLKTIFTFHHLIHITIEHQCYVRVTGSFRHFWSGNTCSTIKCRKHFT
ncbi:hypothetical protein SDC9_116140 [bioreactor metagenome]|uniref:Uncharacterized protein n=1 Tax=bioreactor metagenome TaxID=1076179 RepID=A0A645BUS9_9ZZZZ